MAPTPGPNQTAVITELVHSDEPNKNSKVKHSNSNINEEVDIFNDGYPPLEIVWFNVLNHVLLHAVALYALHSIITGKIMLATLVFEFFYLILGGIGITAGVHRLWSHKAYKAKLPLKIFLAYCQTIAFQMSIYQWARDHRVHHKYTETLADPHNAKRGFFFAHMGWLMAKKHPAIAEKGKQVDLSDLKADPVVMFQKKYYAPLVILCAFAIPSFIPWYFWGETVSGALLMSIFKYAISLHFTWLVNSAAHYFGHRPYDRTMYPRQNPIVSIFALGEGWHNYHHTFPWDYKASELGQSTNYTKYFLDFMASIGQAYDMKTVPDHIVKQRLMRTGDGTHSFSHEIQDLSDFKPGPYAWGDEDIPDGDLAVTETLYPKKDI